MKNIPLIFKLILFIKNTSNKVNIQHRKIPYDYNIFDFPLCVTNFTNFMTYHFVRV